jgi:hypothetical protein
MPETLTVAVCLCNEVTFSDFIPPMEILGALNFSDSPMVASMLGVDMPYHLKVDYLAPTMEPVTSFTPPLPRINPTKTYADALATQYDIIWVPAGL